MSKTAVVTLTIGSRTEQIANITHPTISAYASKIGADFIVINKRQLSKTVVQYEKFMIYELFKKYSRIIYVDTDLIIREDCPDLTKIVDEEHIGMFNEGYFDDTGARVNAMRQLCNDLHVQLESWNGAYYNTGVIVLSRAHRFLFEYPDVEYDNFYEQTFLNYRIAKNKVKVHELNYRYNRMSMMDMKLGIHRLASYIVHYAGCPAPTHELLQLIMTDLDKWERKDYFEDHNLLFKVHGGLGDQICAEPIIRYVRETAYPKAKITVATWFPRLFKHIDNIKLVDINNIKPDFDTPYYVMEPLRSPEDPIWKFFAANLAHNVDFASISCLRKTLPDKDKELVLKIYDEDLEDLAKTVEKPEELVLVHAGRGWPSKSFPSEYWSKVVEEISKSHRVALIGQRMNSDQGTVEVKFDPLKVIDLRNLTNLGTLIALISKAKALVSNDSSPVHIAGAFRNKIILIPSCKHQDHVLHVRNGHRMYRAYALCKKLTLDAFSHNPTEVHGQTIDKVIGDIIDYLPDVGDIVAAIEKED